MKKAIVLLSGGIDSQTCLAIAKQQRYECFALAIDYGQKHRYELQSAEKIAKAQAAAGFRIMSIAMGSMPGVALTDLDEPIPTHNPSTQIKSTYFPARNTIFLSLALSWAESMGAEKIFFGANLDDYHGFPDTRPEYFQAFHAMAQLATKTGLQQKHPVTIETPLISLDKQAIIQLGLELGVDYSLSTTCYQASNTGAACGYCDSCTIRKKAFDSLGIADPAFG